jgi:excisionase family DNA binding protein
MNTLILTTPTELESIVEKAVKLAMSHFKPSSNSNFITIDEASELVKLSKNSIYCMVSKREIPYYKRGKKLYFKTEELLEWIESQKVLTYKEVEEAMYSTSQNGSKNAKKN